MFRHFILGTVAITTIFTLNAYGDLIEVSPSLSDFASISYASNFSCVKSGNTCYYCGSSSSCPSGCTSYQQISAGSYQAIGTEGAAIGCLGTGFCIAPRNGILTYENGLTTSTIFKFYGYSYDSNTHCKKTLTPSVCSSWNNVATTYNGYPFCRCNMITSTTLNNLSCKCDQGYYLSGNSCTRCPSSGSGYGTTITNNTGGITSCYLVPGTTGSDDTGAFTYTDKCYYVQ